MNGLLHLVRSIWARCDLNSDAPFLVDVTALHLSKGETQVVQVKFSPLVPGEFAQTRKVNNMNIQLTATGLSIPQCDSVDECHVNQFNILLAQCENTLKPIKPSVKTVVSAVNAQLAPVLER
jgi:hypothetical protein